MGKRMNKNLTSVFFALSGLIGYFIMVTVFPEQQVERLLFLVCLALTAVFLLYRERKQRLKKERGNLTEITQVN